MSKFFGNLLILVFCGIAHAGSVDIWGLPQGGGQLHCYPDPKIYGDLPAVDDSNCAGISIQYDWEVGVDNELHCYPASSRYGIGADPVSDSKCSDAVNPYYWYAGYDASGKTGLSCFVKPGTPGLQKDQFILADASKCAGIPIKYTWTKASDGQMHCFPDLYTYGWAGVVEDSKCGVREIIATSPAKQ